MSKTILVVEDHEDTRTVYAKALAKENYVVCGAADGPAALRFLNSSDAPPDLILLDLSVPGLDVAEYIRQIRAGSADTKILLVSGWDDLATKTKNLGADGFIRKPFDLLKLYAVIKKHLDQD